ncbi:MAG: serine/threonine transporter SstT [Mogibacterium sp.]|nr:serine/threonine transporter SstT [Mogibacterium sp.]MBR2541195.1 serine/threonine transporter SstT [Mogibacterium sp.]
MNLIKKWTETSLILRILGGLIIGAILGFAVPQLTWLSILGDMFVGALKAIAPLLVFVLVASSLANAKGGNAGKFKLVIALYLISTLVAAVVAVIMNFLFKVTVPLAASDAAEGFTPPGSMGEIVANLLKSIVANPIDAIANANYIAILFWAVIIGMALKATGDATKSVLRDLADGLSQVVRGVINCAPFGILGLVFNAVSTSGLAIFKSYGQLVALLVGTMLFVAFVSNAAIIGITLRHNPYPLIWYCIRNSAVTAFFTRSSAANIPVNMELCKNLGLDEDVYSVSIPLGSTINMDGAAVTITTLTLVAAHTTGVAANLPMAIFLSIVATLSACGTSGVAGGSLLLVPLGCSIFGIPQDIAMQMVGIGFIISVIQDSMETALNSSGDAMFTATSEFYYWKKEGRKLPL